MNELFGARDLSAYQANLEGFTNAVTREATDQAKLNKKVDEYNSELTGVTDPIGLVVGGKPIESLVKKGLKKTLGKTVEAISDARQKAVNERGIGDLEELVEQKKGLDLSGRTQQPRPPAEGAGDPAEPAPTSASEAGQPVERAPAESGEPEPTLGEAAKDPEVFADAVEQYQPELHSGGPEAVEAYRGQVNTNPVLQEAHDLPISKINGADAAKAASSDAAQEPAIAGEAGEAAAQDGTDTLGQDIADQGGRQIAKAIGKGSGKTAAEIAAEAGEAGTESALEGAGVAADAAAGAEGGFNPVADVVAGAIGLATLLGGIFGEKKAKEAQAPQFIVSSQFGT